VFKFRRDFCAGGLMILFGLIAAVNGPNYRVGTLMHMGPGFMPTVLGIILVLLGIAIAGTAAAVTAEQDSDENILPPSPQWLAWLCILSGPLMFIIFGSIGGMAPATFACVFVSAFGDREATWKTSLILAAAMTVFGVLLFHYLLQVPMPVLEWRL
jgi:Tripartite tricarboxylate transporter TctB family